MKQLLQNYKTGRLQIQEVPASPAGSYRVVVRTFASLVSVGTEKSMLELARKSLLGKAMARPDLVRQVIAKAQAEGILEAWRQAMGRLDAPVPLGYSSAGVVIDVGPGVQGFAVGDRVACAGSGYAGHAEVVSVPVNLCVKIPEGVDFESAAFVALGGIALEAVRMARVSLGETVVVIGLGLLGQIAVQLLNAAGCHVIGMDIHPRKAEMALQHGAEAVATDYSVLSALCRQRTGHQGADAVIILAATPSNEPLERAAELCRERGRIVAAGLVGLQIPRKPFYDKELELVVSRAWGPGLYDPHYTEKGLDYPLAYARWTAKRNMEEFLAQLAKGAVRVDHLITHRFPFDRAPEAYELILEGKEPYIGVLLTYEREPDLSLTVVVKRNQRGQRGQESQRGQISSAPSVPSALSGPLGVGLIGAGQFAAGTLLPILKGLKGLRFRGVATATGLSARHVADKFGFEYCTTDYHEILKDPEIALVFILTRHGVHAPLVAEALRAGKHVFVEKPLALNPEQLRELVRAYKGPEGPDGPSVSSVPSGSLLMVGFNRRFSPFAKWLKDRFADIPEPLAVHCTVNAGPVPPDHWVHDPEQGGGRIIGEVCHFVDLIQYLTGSLPVRVYAETLTSRGYKPSDNVVITLKMANGAIGSITYVAGGDKRYPRERVEVFGGGAVGVIENFKAATFIRGGRKMRIRNWLSVDRGHRGEVEALLSAIRAGGPAPVAFEEYVYTTLATFAIEESLRKGTPVRIKGMEETEETEGTGEAKSVG
jgi:predicted dehydrogenase/threonine dehydrogenase-like Zn-dependent dehydrogenase